MDHPHNYGPSNSKRQRLRMLVSMNPSCQIPTFPLSATLTAPPPPLAFPSHTHQRRPRPETIAHNRNSGCLCPCRCSKKLNSICEEKEQPQPGAELRRRLGLLGEEKALEILGEICNTKKKIKTLSGYIWFLLRQEKYQCAPRSRSPSPSPTKSGPAASPLLHSPSSASQTTRGRQGSTSGGQRQLYSYFSASPSKSARTSLFQGPSSALPISPVPQGLFRCIIVIWLGQAYSCRRQQKC